MARLQRRSPFLAGLIVDFDLFILHRELVKMVKGVSSMSLQLSQSGELMDGLGQVASTIPDSPGTPTQDWRSMLAVF